MVHFAWCSRRSNRCDWSIRALPVSADPQSARTARLKRIGAPSDMQCEGGRTAPGRDCLRCIEKEVYF